MQNGRNLVTKYSVLKILLRQFVDELSKNQTLTFILHIASRRWKCINLIQYNLMHTFYELEHSIVILECFRPSLIKNFVNEFFLPKYNVSVSGLT